MCSILAYCSRQADYGRVAEMLSRTISRGPDDSRILDTGNGFLGFNRLAIMGLTPEGMQPFTLNGNAVVCNGELYGFRKMKKRLIEKGYTFMSDSDCEILLPLYEEYGMDMFRFLDAEFALVLYDAEREEYIAARDPVGIRPLYFGRDEKGIPVFASEPKSLVGICERIEPFPPGHYAVISAAHLGPWDIECIPLEHQGIAMAQYSRIWSAGSSLTHELTENTESSQDTLPQITEKIHDKLVAGIEKRLDSDAPIGFLLSGGLDSSLVCGVSARLMDKPLRTFSIGMDLDAIDLKYARKVADYIGSEHYEVIITRDDVIEALDPVIAALGTYDITTIRASIGMYLVCKWIHQNTDVRVIMTGEISDEIFGYKYTDFAPDAEAFQKEAEKRIREIHMYDVLRADRCISVNSLEARVPFGDLDFVSYCMGIDPEKKMNRYGIGKYLLRAAFEKDKLIPWEILMREKAAFSDAVGHSLVNDLIDYAQSLYSDEAFEERRLAFDHAQPFTKESLLYREIFEKYYPGQSEMVADFWMPNREWEGCDVNDPSARVLSNYGASGE